VKQQHLCCVSLLTATADAGRCCTLLSQAATHPEISPEGTYLLGQLVKIGCLVHPSYPAGHAVTSAAAGTILKVMLLLLQCFRSLQSDIKPHVCSAEAQCTSAVYYCIKTTAAESCSSMKLLHSRPQQHHRAVDESRCCCCCYCCC
jgi:hypothetical protein